MSEIDINYKGSSIATMDASGTKTLLTAGKYCEDDIEVVYTRPGGGGTPTLVPYAIRPDAELLHSFSADRHIVADDGVTIPAYSTSQQTLLATANLSPTVPWDVDNYRYFITHKMLTIPEYSISTLAKGREEYVVSSAVYELVRMKANELVAIVNPAKKVSSAAYAWSYYTNHRCVYWNSGTALLTNTSAAYGVAQTQQTPSVSGSSLIIKSPAVTIRGNATYLSQTFYSALDDVRYQYVIDVFRVPLNSLNISGWTQDQLFHHIADCAASSDHTLT